MPTLDVDGATLGYDIRGSGWPLLFLHGAWVDRDLWAPQRERFADRFQVVVPDLRGHGDSSDDGVAVDRMADDVAALCDELGLASPVVCGLSLGGLVAQAFATAHPDRIAGLVLANTVRSVPPVPVPESLRQSLVPTAPAAALVRLWGPGAYFRGLLAAVEAGGRWLALDDGARGYALECVDGYDAAAFVAVLEAFDAHRRRDLEGLRVPTLLLHGDHEAVPVRAHHRALARTLSEATRAEIPDAGHLANRDNPAAFGDRLEAFLDERVTVPA